MNWFRRKRKRGRPKARRPSRFAGVARLLAGVVLWKGFHVGAAIVLAGLLWWGKASLLESARAGDALQVRPHVVLIDVPDGLEDRIQSIVEPAADGAWGDSNLCRRVATALEHSAWVERVVRVRRVHPDRLEIACDYPQSGALVQRGNAFYLLSRKGVRLPGEYTYHPSFVVIQGVRSSPPTPGQGWASDDVKAGLSVLNLLRDEPFFDQISAVDVANYDGRVDRRRGHIELVTGMGSSRIAWGSAPGEEIEENTAAQKMAILRSNHARWGRIDAGQRYIDVFTYSDRFSTQKTGLSAG